MRAFRRHTTRRASLGALVALVAAAALALAACGGSGTAGGDSTASTPATTTAPPASVTVFFPQAGGEALVRTPVPAAGDTLRDAVEALVAGPSDPALDRGLPPGTRVLGAGVADGVATVDLSREFAAAYPPGGAAAEMRALGPLVYTATAVPGVTAVRITVDGATPDVPTQYDLSQPLARRDLPQPAEIR